MKVSWKTDICKLLIFIFSNRMCKYNRLVEEFCVLEIERKM
ncbi:hypothetical protein bmyco0003_26400 [Bacillus pseudomycoides]|nr:hypothetical protein bmyco0002_52530 [Bacillus pseudomycoides]EEM10637.1 hypothetical protein bmyco0003_26400 [Bacillus pseudomycoides]